VLRTGNLPNPVGAEFSARLHRAIEGIAFQEENFGEQGVGVILPFLREGRHGVFEEGFDRRDIVAMVILPGLEIRPGELEDLEAEIGRFVFRRQLLRLLGLDLLDHAADALLADFRDRLVAGLGTRMNLRFPLSSLFRSRTAWAVVAEPAKKSIMMS